VSGILQLLVAGGTSTGGGTLSATKDRDAFANGFAPPTTQTLTTNTVTVTPTGGSGSYTHSWAFASGNNIFTVSNPTGATVTWTGTVGTTEKNAVWRDTVSDGISTVTVDVPVTAQVNF